MRKLCILMRDERPGPHHLRFEYLKKPEIFDQMLCRLIGRSDHHAATDLITQFAQFDKAPEAVIVRHFFRMEFLVVCPVCGLMAEQVTVRTGVKQTLIALLRPLSEGKRNGAVRVFLSYCLHDRHHHVISEVRVLPSLQDDRAKSQLVALISA